VARRPPVWDSPTTRGLWDTSTGLYWAVDSFATPLVGVPVEEIEEMDPEFWQFGMTLFAHGAVAPWLALADDAKFQRHVDGIQSLGIQTLASCHSPVLRGAWLLDSILGTPPPPPPPNVPPLDETHNPVLTRTVRERLEQHRQDPVCASCHSRIDPWGFALENYDAIGRWRTEDAGRPVDVTAQLLDGTKMNGAQELRKALLERNDLFVRNLTSKMLGYALGRGLTLKDSCTVDAIVAKLKQNGYAAQTLIEEIVLSAPFRNQAGARPALKGAQP